MTFVTRENRSFAWNLFSLPLSTHSSTSNGTNFNFYSNPKFTLSPHQHKISYLLPISKRFICKSSAKNERKRAPLKQRPVRQLASSFIRLSLDFALIYTRTNLTLLFIIGACVCEWAFHLFYSVSFLRIMKKVWTAGPGRAGSFCVWSNTTTNVLCGRNLGHCRMEWDERVGQKCDIETEDTSKIYSAAKRLADQCC